MLKFVAILLGMGVMANSAIAMSEGTAQIDTNGDGVMTIDEVQAVFPEVTAEAFAEADADDDGALTDEEMVSAQELGLIPTSTDG
ncbi:MAG TPA: EF-hand domain-containing protein [Roseovarius sp.]|nr:EF-hand domain-containing protein [Roseovarius sp.]